MIILDSEKLKEYFNWISQGFQRNPFEVAIAITAILLILLIPPLIYILLKRRGRFRDHEIQKNKFENSLNSFVLTDSQRQILKQMGEKAWQLRNDYDRVLKSITFFYWIGEQIIKDKLCDYTQLTLLSKCIPGLVNQEPPRLFSTAGLKKNQELWLPVKSRQNQILRIWEVTQQGLWLQMSGNMNLSRNLVLKFQFRQNYYSFSAKLLSQDNTRLFISHSHDLKIIQKRQFFRKKICSRSLLIWSEQMGQAESVIITELSGNGARIEMAKREPLIGESLTFELPILNNYLQIRAHVVRVLKSKYFSVTFDSLADVKRDKIIKHYILAKKNEN